METKLTISGSSAQKKDRDIPAFFNMGWSAYSAAALAGALPTVWSYAFISVLVMSPTL